MNLKQTIRKVLTESMKVDDWGRLHVEEEKILYPYKKISKFVDWFQKEWGDYATKQGWAIFDSDTEISHQKYKFEPSNKFMSVFQVQRLDSPDEGEALFGRLKNDYAADDLAKKLGLMLDEFGIVIGWDGESFLEDNNLKESSKRITIHEPISIPREIKRRMSLDKEEILNKLKKISVRVFVGSNIVFPNIETKVYASFMRACNDVAEELIYSSNLDYNDKKIQEVYNDLVDFFRKHYFEEVKEYFLNFYKEKKEKNIQEETESVVCKCGWSWKLSDGGDDPYVCHKCGNDNSIKEGELTEKCWKGYTQKGMKTMFGKRYPNCVKKKK